jgi:hypothetical protein
MKPFFIRLATPWELWQFDICIFEPNLQQLMQLVEIVIPPFHLMMYHVDIEQQICFLSTKKKYYL